MSCSRHPNSELLHAEISRILNRRFENLPLDTHLINDLGMDSLDMAELSVFISKYHKTSKPTYQTVGDVLKILEQTQKVPQATKNNFSWPAESKRPAVQVCESNNLGQAFLEVCDRMGSSLALGDDFLGVLSYKKFKRFCLVLAEHFRSYPEPRVAVLLPSSASAYIVIFALQLAGKIPVMLNWTLGCRYLEQMMVTSEAKRVISSESFIQRISHVDFGTLVNQFVFLEKTIRELSLWTKFKGLFFRKAPIEVDENNFAVILFTSGTENIPKAVPLSHKNLLEHHRAVAKAYPVENVLVSYSLLPPFHSLGFSVSGISLLLLGIKTAFYPNPADGAGVAEGIEKWNISHFWTAPTFLKNLLAVATPQQLRSLQVVFCGGEKIPPQLHSQLAALNSEAKIIEGYGISECSPAVALGLADGPQIGVGKIFPSVSVKVIDLETQNPLDLGQVGQICVSGSTVFQGYLNSDESPFIEFEGKKWFKTGDVGKLDQEGNLHFLGRLKRFAKIGAEMISLSAIEATLHESFNEPVPSFVVCSHGEDSGRGSLILFAVKDVDLQSVTRALKNAGWSNLIQFKHIETVSAFPEAGIGKIDYRKLLMNSKFLKI